MQERSNEKVNAMNDVVMSIAVVEARSACKGEPDVTERIKKAMRACHDHWMVTAEPQRLNAALAAAALESDAEQKERILRSGRAFNKLNNSLGAAASGVSVDFGAMAGDPDLSADDLLPVRKLWDETKP